MPRPLVLLSRLSDVDTSSTNHLEPEVVDVQPSVEGEAQPVVGLHLPERPDGPTDLETDPHHVLDAGCHTDLGRGDVVRGAVLRVVIAVPVVVAVDRVPLGHREFPLEVVTGTGDHLRQSGLGGHQPDVLAAVLGVEVAVRVGVASDLAYGAAGLGQRIQRLIRGVVQLELGAELLLELQGQDDVQLGLPQAERRVGRDVHRRLIHSVPRSPVHQVRAAGTGLQRLDRRVLVGVAVVVRAEADFQLSAREVVVLPVHPIDPLAALGCKAGVRDVPLPLRGPRLELGVEVEALGEDHGTRDGRRTLVVRPALREGGARHQDVQGQNREDAPEGVTRRHVFLASVRSRAFPPEGGPGSDTVAARNIVIRIVV